MDKRLGKIEQYGFWFMCGFALFSSISVAIGNIFLSLGIAALLIRLYHKHDDLKLILDRGKWFTYSFAFLLMAVFFSAIASSEPVRSLRFFGDYYFYRLCGFYIVLLMIRDKEKLLTLLKFAALSCAINGIHCLVETFVYGSTRADGFTFSMTTGGILSMWGPLAVVFTLSSFEKGRYRLLSSAFLIFMIIAMLCNQTRGTWVAFAMASFAVIVLFVRDLKKTVVILLGASLFVGTIFAAVPELNKRVSTITDLRMSSNYERLLLWTSGYNMFRDHPVLGIGFAEFAPQYKTKYILPEAKYRNLTHAHNNIIQMLAECGIIGVIAWFIFWGYALWLGASGWHKKHKLAYLAWFAVILGLLIQGLTEYNQGNSVVTKELWFLMGVLFQLMHLPVEGKYINKV